MAATQNTINKQPARYQSSSNMSGCCTPAISMLGAAMTVLADHVQTQSKSLHMVVMNYPTGVFSPWASSTPHP